jgi:hypothetical protein
MPNAKWTVMVYMAAGDGADLDTHAINDLLEMERAKVGSDVNVVVQINRYWPSKPQRYRIAASGTVLVRADVVAGEPILDGDPRPVDAGDASMGAGDTLSNFMRWARHYYPADRYFLVLWGHSYGLGFGRDHGDPMTLRELRQALRSFGTSSHPKLDLLGANACAISYVEAAYELRDYVHYLVASEIAVPLVGWPYDAILGSLSRLLATPDTDVDPPTLGQLVADQYVTQFKSAANGECVAMTLLDLGAAGDVAACIGRLTDALIAATDGTDKGAGERRAQIRTAFLSTASGDVRPLIDLQDLADRLNDMCGDLEVLAPHSSLDAIRTEARKLKKLLEPRMPTREPAQAEPAFVAMTTPSEALEGLNGVGVFAPFVTDDRDLKRLGFDAATPETGRQAYEDLLLMKLPGNKWAELVFDRLRNSLPDAVLAGIESSGAAGPAERSAVMQMLASVDSTFDALDRRILATRARVLALMPVAATGTMTTLDAVAFNMLGKMKLVRHADVDKMLKESVAALPTARGVGSASTSTTAPPWSGQTLATSDDVKQAATAFVGLEGVIGRTERTVRRTLTNGTFGLGPGLGRDKDGLLGRDKDGLLGRDKDGLLGRDKDGLLGRDKDGLLGRDKDGLLGRDKDGLLGRDKDGLLGLAAALAAEPSPGAVIADLFLQVGVSLKALENAGADVETLATKALLAPGGVQAFEALSTVTLAKARLERAFQELSEASADARLTLRRVVTHPTYGIGPGPREVTVSDRQEFARAGGLSSADLALL